MKKRFLLIAAVLLLCFGCAFAEETVSSNMPEGANVVYDPAMQVLDYSR